MKKSINFSIFGLFVILTLSCCKTEKLSEKDWVMAPFVKIDEANPVLEPIDSTTFYCPVRQTEVQWEEKDVFNPAATVKDNKIYLLYRAEDTIGKYAGTSRIGLAESADGFSFKRHPKPVLFPDNDQNVAFEWEGGCEDPRIVEDETGRFYMTYTAYDGDKARLFVASSKDLVSWIKHGSVFKNTEGGKYVKIWTKAGSIVTKMVDGKLVAAKINGLYWMLFGESNIYTATSPNLIDWTPVQEEDPEKKQFDEKRNHEAFKIVFAPRKGMFDSDLVEPGPPAILTDKGIVFIYNSRNSEEYGDPSYAGGTYSAGQVLLDANNPTQVIARTNKPFITPDKDYEIEGQVNHVCFVEGLVFFKGKWFLYYGTADSKIAVATYSKN